MVVDVNPVTGTTTVTLDESDKQLLVKALWDEQLLYVRLLAQNNPYAEALGRRAQWEERLQRLTAMTVQLGGNAARS